jgi:hypothetical protein
LVLERRIQRVQGFWSVQADHTHAAVGFGYDGLFGHDFPQKELMDWLLLA